MKRIEKIKKYRDLAFQLLAIRAPKARYSFIRHGRYSNDFFSMPADQLRLFGFKNKDINFVQNNYVKLAEEEISRAKKNSIEIIFREDPEYPIRLKEIFDPPLLLYVLGDKSVLKKEKQLAVVGSRKGNNYGLTALKILLPSVVKEGIPVVSGMAYGIDAMAHNIALKEGGETIGVNAGGLLHLYPAGNRQLAKRIVSNGCIISEFPLDTIPRPFLFPIRNRIIAGLSGVILLPQAEMRSGSLITARLGVEQNREIIAVPGHITDPLSSGTNYLIQQGAKPATSSSDILEEFGIEKKPEVSEMMNNLSSVEKKFLDLIEVNEVKGIDYFVERAEYSISEVITVLMGLVLKSVIVEEKGGFRRLV